MIENKPNLPLICFRLVLFFSGRRDFVFRSLKFKIGSREKRSKYYLKKRSKKISDRRCFILYSFTTLKKYKKFCFYIESFKIQ